MAINWQTTALIFPGQGSQQVGMGKALADAFPAAAEIYTQADAILGYSLSDLCFNGPAEQLNDTLHTQPAMFVAGVAALRAMQAQLGEVVKPAYVAGHSLGEFTALVAAGALTFEDGLRLVQRRATLMKEAGEKAPGAVAALLGPDVPTVQQLCADAQAETGEIVVLANDNCPGQVVISGSEKAIDAALRLAPERGAKRAVKLPVSVAVHSPLMTPAGEEFKKAVAAATFHAPQMPVIANVTAQPLTTADAIREELMIQLTSSVRWTESVRTMLANGATTFIELGQGNVLVGLLKRIDRAATGITVEKPEDIAALA